MSDEMPNSSNGTSTLTPGAAGMASRPQPGGPTILSSSLTIEGKIKGDGELRIDCTVKGDVEVAKVVVGPQGSVEGTITGKQVEVRGKVMGNIVAQRVSLLATAHVEGDISNEEFAVEVGAFFQGTCHSTRPQGRTRQ